MTRRENIQKVIIKKLLSSLSLNVFFPSMRDQRWLKKFLRFVNVEIEKKSFHSSNTAIDANEIDIQKILVPYGFAYGKNKNAGAK